MFSSTLRVQDGRIVPPGSAGGAGGEAAVVLWEAVVGEPVTRPERFIAALFTLAEGRLANLYNTIGHLDPARQRFALGLWIAEPVCPPRQHARPGRRGDRGVGRLAEHEDAAVREAALRFLRDADACRRRCGGPPDGAGIASLLVAGD